MKKIIITTVFSIALMGCTHHSYIAGYGDANKYTITKGANSSNSKESPIIMKKLPEIGGDINILNAYPNATAFRMSGDYANNVAVTLAPSGELIYFPAPGDITADSEPVELGEGWWLNNQGIGPNSVFTKYTFAEYAALPSVPSIEQLKQSIIPGAKVTDFMELPYKIGSANQNIEEIKNFIKKGQ